MFRPSPSFQLQSRSQDTLESIRLSILTPSVRPRASLHSVETLASATVQAARLSTTVSTVTIHLRHAITEYVSERYYQLQSTRSHDLWGPLSGLYPCKDRYVRLHDSFPDHQAGIVKLLNCDGDKEQVEKSLERRNKVDFETEAREVGIAAHALRRRKSGRTFLKRVNVDRLDSSSRAKAKSHFPVEDTRATNILTRTIGFLNGLFDHFARDDRPSSSCRIMRSRPHTSHCRSGRRSSIGGSRCRFHMDHRS